VGAATCRGVPAGPRRSTTAGARDPSGPGTSMTLRSRSVTVTRRSRSRSRRGRRGDRRSCGRPRPATRRRSCAGTLLPARLGGLAVRSWRNASSMTTSTRLTAKLTAVPAGRTPPTSGQPAPEPTPPGTGRRPARQPRQLQAVSILSRVKPGPPDPRCPHPARPRSPGTVPASPSTPAPPPLPAPPGNQPGNQEHHRLNHVRRMPPGTDKAGRNVSTAA
jgi:hypothetical protein